MLLGTLTIHQPFHPMWGIGYITNSPDPSGRQVQTLAIKPIVVYW